jgi:predicted RNase H-like HicB family nuclease
MEIQLTAVFRKFPQGYAAFVEEVPGANTQGATLEEARENLKEAVAIVLQANRELAEESLRGADVAREVQRELDAMGRTAETGEE